MTEKRGWGSTVLGWFVVKEGESEPQADGDSRPAEEPAPDTGADAVETPQAAAFGRDLPPAPGGNVDFDAVFATAGIEDEERARVTKARELLAALPEGTDPAVKKQIVEASLKAFGVPLDRIIEAAVAEIQALEVYIRAGGADTVKLHEESNARIAQYEEEIRRIKTVMDERTKEQAAVAASCNRKKLEVQRILEFFGQEAVAKVVRESPKLVEPGAAS